jgi:hypothetical protein
VYDTIAAVPDHGCSMRELVEALPDIDRKSVISAVHRLSEQGVLRLHQIFGVGPFYAIAPGAMRPTDGRGRPRRSERSTLRLESSPATLRGGASG